MIFPSPVRADGSKSIFIGCSVLHVAQSRTAGNALLISSICSEKDPEYGIVWSPDIKSERNTRCRHMTGSRGGGTNLIPSAAIRCSKLLEM
jgi:hypothetical protein